VFVRLQQLAGSRRSSGAPIIYFDDEMLGYRSGRKMFPPGERIVFDEGYRLAHLPPMPPIPP
jgi:hypothetical protein